MMVYRNDRSRPYVTRSRRARIGAMVTLSRQTYDSLLTSAARNSGR
ncbi:hypothetical protein I552_6737 [Mycobacterium xenopi 3993]|nr:hypothetical protein I552_6737 [Mycobacterium xenopi 3993]